MNIFCWWYRTKLTAYASSALPEGLATRVGAHLDLCPTCRIELEANLRLVDALRIASPVVASPNPYLWERLEAAMQAEAPAPRPSPLRRLAPLGAVVLAGSALAAVAIVRSGSVVPTVSPTPATVAVAVSPVPPLQVAKVSPPEAVVASQITTRRPELPLVARHHATRRSVPKVLSTLASGQAVELVEVGTRRVVEVVHTEALNRMVTETEKDDVTDKSRRAVCLPADATSIAQNTRSLFQ